MYMLIHMLGLGNREQIGSTEGNIMRRNGEEFWI